jgi:lipoprotein-releasing system ATP-binding protein
MSVLLGARGLRKVYRGAGDTALEVLTGVDLEVAPGEAVAIVGASGAGKSTLLHLLGALDEPTAGSIQLDGVAYDALGAEQRDELRNRRIGFVFQFHHLLREFTALENVMMPLLIGGSDDAAARDRAEAVLAQVGLKERVTHRPPELSGGEQQRCAVARAMVHEPRVLLADEPSGNLDHANHTRLVDLLFSLARERGTALVVVTHNQSLAERADRVLLLQDGCVAPAARTGVIP